MAVLLVTYDLKKPGQDYSGFHKIIKSYPCARLSESSYAIQTAETPREIFNKLVLLMDKNDQIYIICLRRPYHGLGQQEVDQWLNQSLGSKYDRTNKISS